ncbi:MBL fold metallo-hydrolase [bacterium]|nr:MBL fold metallo-hydrolase [bacterium]
MQIIQIKSSGGDNFSYLIGPDFVRSDLIGPDFVRSDLIGPDFVRSDLLGSEHTKNALVIDPSWNTEAILNASSKRDWCIQLIVNTHGHGDHTAGNAELKRKTGAPVVVHEADVDLVPDADRLLSEETVLRTGDLSFQVIYTPGHTPGGICLLIGGNLFTGDTLFVGDSGRTDLPGGHRPTLGASIRRLMTLDENTVVWPGHDYGPVPSSTLGWEKRHNVNAAEYGFFG